MCFSVYETLKMVNFVQQWVWFADSQKSRFQDVKPTEMTGEVLQCCWCSGIKYSGCVTFRNGHCRHEKTSICWYSGIVFWGLETFTYGLCYPNMWSIWWCSGIAFKAANHSNVGSAIMNFLPYPDSQESRFQASKRSYISCAALLCGRFADAQ